MARTGGLVDLRLLRGDDIESLASWLPAVAKIGGYDAWADADALSGAVERENVLVVDSGEGIDCFLSYETRSPMRDAVQVTFLAVEPGRRRLGIAGRAAMALEERARGVASRIHVAVPADLGLALYFWLRLGYRPLTQRKWPARPAREPSVWMVRELSARDTHAASA